MKLNLCCLLVLLLVSCGNNKNLDSVALYNLSKIDANFSMQLDSIISGTEIIPLEKNDSCLVGKISDIKESERYYFIVSNNRLYKFDKSGNYIKKIGTEGRGPQEYLAIKNIGIDDKKQIIYLLDYYTQKMMKYNYDGSFVSSFKFDLPQYSYVSSFYLYQDRIILDVANNSIKMEIYNYDEIKGKMDIISMKERDMVTGEGVLGTVLHFGKRAEPYLYNYFNDTVYKLKNFTLEPDFLIESGDFKFTFEEMANLENPIPGSKIQVLDIVQGSKYTFIFYTVTKFNNKRWNNFLALFNNETGTYYQNVRLTKDKSDYLSITSYDKIFQGSNDDCIIMVQNPARIIESEPTSNVKEDDNPILIKYKIK